MSMIIVLRRRTSDVYILMPMTLMTLLWHVWLAPLQSKGLHMYTEGNLAPSGGLLCQSERLAAC